MKAKASKIYAWNTVYSKQGNGPYKFNPSIASFFTIFNGYYNTVRLKMVSILDSPFTMKAPFLYSAHREPACERGLPCQVPQSKGISTKWTKNCCIGYVVDLLQLLMKDLHFDVDFYIVEDGYYGSFHKGIWNGMIGDVAYKKADAAIAGLTITRDRSKYVDFTDPFMRQDVGIVTLLDKGELSFLNWQFLNPLKPEVLYAVLISLLIGTVGLYFIENQMTAVKRLIDPAANPPVYSWREGFSYFAGLTFQRDLGGKNPKKYGSRLMSLTFAFSMLVVMTTYTAVLTASKVKHEPTDVFKGVKDPRVSMKYISKNNNCLAKSDKLAYWIEANSDSSSRTGRMGWDFFEASSLICHSQNGVLSLPYSESFYFCRSFFFLYV